MGAHYRIGLIVPSSNTTIETELPAMLRAREQIAPETFTFHAARARMQHVTPEELAAMIDASEHSAVEVADARVHAIAYACLVAVMAQGPGAHTDIERRLAAAAEGAGSTAPVLSSAGALVGALHTLGAKRIALIAPYMKPLTQLVSDYIAATGIEVRRSISLEVDDNQAVGALDPHNLIDIANQLDTSDVDALVLSACVQMPSLPAIPTVEQACGIPVVTAATATTYALLRALELPTLVPDAGTLLTGRAPATVV